MFFQIVCGPLCSSNPLSTVEWYLVFTILCIVLSQLPNLNSIAGLSLIGAVTAITYATMAWLLSVSQERPPSISYQPMASPSFGAAAFSILNALGIIAFAFRGHNLTLEIQVFISWSQIVIFLNSASTAEWDSYRHFHDNSMRPKKVQIVYVHLFWFDNELLLLLDLQATMPSTFKHPAHVPMWRGAKVAYLLIAMCLFPIAIGGFWAYGDLVSIAAVHDTFTSICDAYHHLFLEGSYGLCL